MPLGESMKSNDFPYQGSCLCGAVRYRVRRFTPHMAHCHCSMCRKFHGAAFATFGEALSDDFEWISGRSALKAYRADNGTTRRFCSHCGSSMAFESSRADGSVVEIALGTLDTPLGQRPDANIFVASKAEWYTISDDLPAHAAGRQPTDED